MGWIWSPTPWSLTARPWKVTETQKENTIFQPSIFRGELLNFGGVRILTFYKGVCFGDTDPILYPTQTEKGKSWKTQFGAKSSRGLGGYGTVGGYSSGGIVMSLSGTSCLPAANWAKRCLAKLCSWQIFSLGEVGVTTKWKSVTCWRKTGSLSNDP